MDRRARDIFPGEMFAILAAVLFLFVGTLWFTAWAEDRIVPDVSDERQADEDARP